MSKLGEHWIALIVITFFTIGCMIGEYIKNGGMA